MKLYKGHVEPEFVGLFTGVDPTLAEEGMDLLVTVHDDGQVEAAGRPGINRRGITWSPPVTLEPEPIQ